MAYTPKTDWTANEIVSPEDMNKIEQGIADVDTNKFNKTGDAKDVVVTFSTVVNPLSNIASGNSLTTIFGKVYKLIADFMSFKTSVSTNLAETNTGDETNSTIKTKLGTDLSNKLDKTGNAKDATVDFATDLAVLSNIASGNTFTSMFAKIYKLIADYIVFKTSMAGIDNMLQLVNIYTGTADAFSYNSDNLVEAFKKNGNTKYFYVAELKIGDVIQTASIVSTTGTLVKNFAAGSHYRMVIPLISNTNGTVYTAAIINAFLHAYFPNMDGGYLPNYCGTPFLFEDYTSAGLTVQRYSDGRMEQMYINSFGSTPLTTAYGSIFRTAADAVWTFSIPFTSIPNISKNLMDAGIGDLKVIATATAATFTPFNYVSATISFTIQAAAKGNWR